MRKERDIRRADAAIARLAANQHGVVTSAQLASVGLSPAGITRRISTGRLHRIHRGVYAVGHRHLSEQGRWMAAVLACGERAVLSHLSAGEHWGVIRRDRRPIEAGGRGKAAVHVTVPSTAGKRRRMGIVLHRSATLHDRQCTRHDGIPVTSPARTIADLRPLLSSAEFNSAVREAEFLRLPIHLREADRARTELEQRMLAICRRHRLPRPEVNVKIDRYEVDFLWPAARLIVEVDGWGSHRSRSAFEEDRIRDARLTVLGYRVVRFTWRRLQEDGPSVARTVRALLVG